MRVMALDLGVKTGWACLQGHGTIVSGTQEFQLNKRTEGAGMRFLRFNQWLGTMHNIAAFERVAFEEIKQRQQSVAAANAYGGFLAHLTAWCELNKVPYEGLLPSEIKKHATGKGNAKKDAMIAAMRVKGHQLAGDADNEADALALLYYVIEHATPSTPNFRPAPDREPKGRVQVAPVRLSRRPV